MCKIGETAHSIFEPIKPFEATQDPGFEYISLDPVTNSNPYQCGEIIRFAFPAKGILYPESLSLMFNLKAEIPLGGGRNFTFCNDIKSIFQYCRVLHGRSVLFEDIQEFGMLSKIMTLMTEPIEQALGASGPLKGTALETSVTNLVGGSHDLLNYHNVSGLINTLAGAVPRRYMVPLTLGFFHKSQKPIPLSQFQENLILEFKLHDSIALAGYLPTPGGVNVLSSPLQRSNMQVGRPQLRMKVDSGDFDLEEAITRVILERQLQYQWESYYHQKYTLNTLATTQRIEVNCFKRRIKYALAVIRSEADITDLSQDPTSTYVALDPRAPFTGQTALDQARKTTLADYQWRYNNRLFPEQPVEVCHVRPVEDGATTGNPNTYTTTATNATSTGADAYYYLQETLMPGQSMTGPSNRDYPWMTLDSGAALVNTTTNPPLLTRLSTGLSQALNGTMITFPCSFVIAGKFSYTGADGVSQFALDGTGLNTKLELVLHFNNSTVTSPAGAPSMYMDIWVAYDSVLTLSPDSEHELDQ